MGVFHVFKIVQMVPNRTKCFILTLSAPTKQNGQTNCLGMFDHFVGLALKGLNNTNYHRLCFLWASWEKTTRSFTAPLKFKTNTCSETHKTKNLTNSPDKHILSKTRLICIRNMSKLGTFIYLIALFKAISTNLAGFYSSKQAPAKQKKRDHHLKTFPIKSYHCQQ